MIDVLPDGYEIRVDEHKMGWNAYKNGLILRRNKLFSASDRPGQPMWFRDEDKAKTYIWKHRELVLEAHQEVPNWKG